MSGEPTIVLECRNCERSNRVPLARLADHAHCGNCHQKLHDPGEPMALNCESLDTLVKHAPGPVLVDFFTRDSQPARYLNHELVRVAKDMAPDMLVAEVDCDSEALAVERYRVRSAPLLVLFRNGKEVWRDSGARSAVHLEHQIREVLQRAA